MDKNKFFIGIDSGGTKGEMLVSETSGKILLRKIYKPLHYSADGMIKTASCTAKVVRSGLREYKLDLKDCKGICIGYAGARYTSDKTALKKKLFSLLGIRNIIVESDSAAALYGAFKGRDGLILICGTGSILFGLHNKIPIRIGGWGRIIGDHGSGYEIGKAAIRHAASEYDRNKKPGKLTREIEKRFSINRKNLLNHIYRKNFELQSLAPLVLKLAESGDRDSMRIIKETADNLLMHIEIFSSISKKRKTDLALTGSIIENDNILSRLLRSRIKKSFGSKINLINKIHTPAEGAVLLAKHKFQKS
ncbi:MAG: hypothetical protein HY959_07165 [Ignavibacteriae bacterium]|nr:hypothetical protein [Ignavibacteriota bacterium]